MKCKNEHFRHILLFYFRKEKYAAQAAKKLRDAYGEEALKRDEPPQTTSKAELHQKKFMLSVWWDWKGVVFFEVLPRNQTINSDFHGRQLNKLNAEVNEKRPELVNY